MPQVPLDAGDRWMARSVCFVTCGVAAGIVAAVVNAALSGGLSEAASTWAQLGELGLLAPGAVAQPVGAPDAAARLLALQPAASSPPRS